MAAAAARATLPVQQPKPSAVTMVRLGPFELTLVHPNGEPLPEVEKNGQAFAVAVRRALRLPGLQPQPPVLPGPAQLKRTVCHPAA